MSDCAHILIACMPKSRSTLLTKMISESTGYTNTPFVKAYSQNEQDLYLPSMLMHKNRNTITQQHVRATVPNVDLLRLFNTKNIILFRNIFDVCLSYRDHLLNESIEVHKRRVNMIISKLIKSKRGTHFNIGKEGRGRILTDSK